MILLFLSIARNKKLVYCANCGKLVDFFIRFDIIYKKVNAPCGQQIKECYTMFSKEVLVTCQSGLHNKQATYFVQKANEFDSMVYLEADNRRMNAKSLLGIMSLGILSGTTVTLSATGSDAEAAVNALEELLLKDVY